MRVFEIRMISQRMYLVPFFGNILCLSNFRESANTRALATDASPERYKNSVFKSLSQ